MRKWLSILMCMLCTAQSPTDIANAELAFAKLAADKGIHSSFMTNLAAGSLVLRPEPVDARAFYGNDKDPGQLSWRPTWVGLSASGDLAYSTGPWEYRATKDAAPLVEGHYLSIWAKEPNGTWKVTFDCGVPHGHRSEQAQWGAFLPSAPPPSRNAVAMLKAADRKFTDGRSLAQALAFGATVYRSRALPMESRSAVMDTLADEPTRHFEPQGAVVSKAQDLGYTWGVATSEGGIRVSYLHIWVRPGGAWSLLYDLELLMPKRP